MNVFNILVSPKLHVVSSMAPENSLLSSARLCGSSNSSVTSPENKAHASSNTLFPLSYTATGQLEEHVYY